MTVYNLANDKYSLSVDEKGAELKSLLVHGREYIWQGDSEWWGKSAPLLFPIIGRVPDGKYSWKEATYEMTKHGFVRDQVFELVQTSPTRLQFQLKRENLSPNAHAWVLKNYPFNFILTVAFHLVGNGLQVAWEVENVGEDALPFSIGAHPALVFPSQSENITVDSMMIDFGHPVTLERLFLDDSGLRNGLTEPLVDGDSQLVLHSDMFKDDCIQFRLSSLDSLTLRNLINNDAIKLAFHGFTHFGIWTPYQAGRSSPFLCLEPWYGNDSSVFDDGSFENKEGIITLDPGAVFKTAYSLEIEQ